MSIKNIKGLLIQGTRLPAAVEGALPEGAPKISTMLVDMANKIPAVPDFPMELPDLPPVPTLPEMPGAPALGRQYVSGVEVRRVGSPTPISAARPLGEEILS